MAGVYSAINTCQVSLIHIKSTQMLLNKNNIQNLFYIFITTHLILWTLIPSLTNNNLPLDTIEALAWGSNLDWGFNKHPPGSAFFHRNDVSNFWSTRLGILFIKSNICHYSFYCCF